MTRKEFEAYLKDLALTDELQSEYWRVYDKINEPGSPLTFSQRAYYLLGELRKINKKEKI